MSGPDAMARMAREVAIWARQQSADALLAHLDALDAEIAEPGYDDDSDAVARALATPRRDAIAAELARRERLSRIQAGVASPSDERYEGWRAMTREVRERTDLADVFRAAGWDLRREGRDPRRGGSEWRGPCPLCAGRDRLRVFDGPNGRAWCRRCAWSADAITAAQSLLPGCAEFRDAVRTLAGWLSLPTPDCSRSTVPETPGIPNGNHSGNHRRIAPAPTFAFTAGKVVRR